LLSYMYFKGSILYGGDNISAKNFTGKSYTSTSPYVFMAWCRVKKRGNFACTFAGS